MTLPSLLTIAATTAFLLLERLHPGRPLPDSAGWYVRALAINFAQLGITLATRKVWVRVFGGHSLMTLGA